VLKAVNQTHFDHNDGILNETETNFGKHATRPASAVQDVGLVKTLLIILTYRALGPSDSTRISELGLVSHIGTLRRSRSSLGLRFVSHNSFGRQEKTSDGSSILESRASDLQRVSNTSSK
jgi:hypothetical protein